ncbi:GTP 3',8-cyclase MoaA [Devosia neptuniae]|jgi:cyclic pyranopterin phosphate synthase|uniref:GTP 3',8-cyclase MoaA n=1 Tax=Devosia TaxID=46913 RepID=UPI0022B05FF1|nr:GTP 3',8-cyclase MoaA [Devosia neptuniae]MCZ4344927.1 GTP 3',8-cyclase MoaA [Devosia neptuniae]|tara:strand:- start:171810 stop:172823 length:1014 start_codon:yes stop_codon:yes gene_type:complete
MISTASPARPLVDRYGRHISYLRISVTDRCDFRCVYCMAEDMTFLPKRDVLSFEEIETIAGAFIARGATRIRLTGGEPLVRRDIMGLVATLGARIGQGLEELTITTNGSQLAKHADGLAAAGVKRINVSLDTLDEARFAAITRRGRLTDVMDGIAAAQSAGIAIKINMVAMRGVNDDEIEPMMAWAHGRKMGLTLIEGMPLGEVGIDRVDSYLPLRELHDQLARRYTLEKLSKRTGGPARYVHVAETGGVLGFITPMSHNFCESCNRVRLTATGQLFMCLGQDDQVNLRDALRTGGAVALDAALDQAMLLKPKGHDFVLDRSSTAPSVARHMSVTGG